MRLWLRATLSKEGTLGGVPRFDMAHEAVLVQIGESSVRTKALTSCRAPSYQQIDAAAKLATWRLLARLGLGGWRRRSTKPRFIRARTAIVCVGPTTLWLSGALLLVARVVWHTCVFALVRAACVRYSSFAVGRYLYKSLPRCREVVQRVVARRALRHERAPEEHVQLGHRMAEAGEPECRGSNPFYENTRA